VDWELMVAATTKYYGWSPRDALGMRLSELRWWHDMARQMEAQNGK